MGSLFPVIAILFAALASVSSSAQQDPGPIVIVTREQASPEQVIYTEGAVAIEKVPGTAATDFKDLYVVTMPLDFNESSFLEEYGELLGFVPGQFAVMRIGPGEIQALSANLHHEMACGVLFKLEEDIVPGLSPALPKPLLPVDVSVARVKEATALVAVDNIEKTVAALAQIETRHADTTSGQGIASFLAEKYRAFAGSREDVSIASFDHSNTRQHSIIVQIRGQAHPDQIIVLGSHIDSRNFWAGPDSRAPGADDDASGTATTLEVFRILMQQNIQLDRTLEIHGYAAEELGLIGSQEIARTYRERDADVLAMMQLDMSLYKPTGAPDMIYFVTSNTSPGFNFQLEQLADLYTGVRVGRGPLLRGGRSDHISWSLQGFATAFPFEDPKAYNSQIHTAKDTIENSGQFGQAAAFAKLAVAYSLHFAGISRREGQ